MKRFTAFIALLFITVFSANSYAQVVSSEPDFPTMEGEITVIFDASEGNQGLMGYIGDIYAHTGVITDQSTGDTDWKYVKTSWGENTPATKLTQIGTDLYELKITPDIASYYGVPSTEKVLKIAFVFRAADNSKEGKDAGNADIFLTVYQNDDLTVKIDKPASSNNLLLVESNDVIDIEVSASETCDLSLWIDNTQMSQTTGTAISYTHTVAEQGKNWIIVKGIKDDETLYDSLYFYVMQDVVTENLSADVRDGINYIDNQTVTLVFYAPYKENVFVIGDFNNWELSEDYFMKRTPDGKRYWLTINNLEEGKEYIYQYLIDGELKIADPYTNKTSDPWNDHYIPDEVYPDLIEYPENKTSGLAAVLQTGQITYQWEVTDFTPVKKEDMVIYELHIRDFSETSDLAAVFDKLDYLEELGVNVLELMPINEFEGNDSWGYNPSFYFATDKAYGTTEKYKQLIDECHKRGIAVVIDMVLNHSYGQSPFVQMYFDASTGQYGQPTAENPWYNQTSPNQAYSWGFDFDHDSPETRQLVDSVVHFWLSEFKVDGFRFDFTKGFTNTPGDGWAYDAARINILKRMADKIWSVNENALVILEHLADNSEETVLANYGMMMWGNMNHQYNQIGMGYGSDSNLDWALYSKRNWEKPNLVAYMESHDEERLMYKALTWGASNDSYDVTDLNTALHRMKATAGFYFTIPGPKMIWQFGELGYDYSINENDRVGRKPIKWEYYDVTERRELYNFYSYIIDLTKTYDAFETLPVDYQLNGLTKYIKYTHESGNFVVVGNFDLTWKTITPGFQQTGTWYNCITGESLDVADTNQDVELAPGEIRIYTNIQTDNFISEIKDGKTGRVLRIFPNPAETKVNIQLDNTTNKAATIQLYDISGRCVYNKRHLLADGQTNVMLNHIAQTGIYLMQIIANSNTYRSKLVIE